MALTEFEESIMRCSTWFLTILLIVAPIAAHGQDRAWLAEEETPVELAVREAMDRTVSLSLDEGTLADAVHKLGVRAGIEIAFDTMALRDAKIDPEMTVERLNVHGVSLRLALDLVLDPLDLTWLIHLDGLLITTKTEAENLLDTRFYPVDDLVVDRRGGIAEYGALIELMMATIKPGSWDETGGPGTAKGFDSAGIHALVVSQTREQHEEIASLLAALRRLRAKGVNHGKSEVTTPTPASKAKSPRKRARAYVAAPDWTAPQAHE